MPATFAVADMTNPTQQQPSAGMTVYNYYSYSLAFQGVDRRVAVGACALNCVHAETAKKDRRELLLCILCPYML